MRTGLWDRQGATIASRYKEMYGVELCFAQTNVNHFTLKLIPVIQTNHTRNMVGMRKRIQNTLL